jgi:hypothetical protein
MGRPAGVTQAVGSPQGLLFQLFDQPVQLALGLDSLELSVS